MPKPIRVSARVAIPKTPEAPILASTSDGARDGSGEERLERLALPLPGGHVDGDGHPAGEHGHHQEEGDGGEQHGGAARRGGDVLPLHGQRLDHRGVDAPDDEPLRGDLAATRPRAAARRWRRPAGPGGATRRG